MSARADLIAAIEDKLYLGTDAEARILRENYGVSEAQAAAARERLIAEAAGWVVEEMRRKFST